MALEYIYQVSEQIEGRVTEKLSKEFSRTESRILAALTMLDEFLLNTQVRTCSVAVLGTFRNNDSENGEPIGDRSLSNPCPEAVFSTYHSSNLNDSEQDETHHMLTVVQGQLRYCSSGTSSRKQKKARSTSQPQFRSEKTPTTNEADKIL